VLELGKQEDVGSRLNKLIAADDEGTRSRAGVEAHQEWQATRSQVRGAAGAETLRVATATEHALAVAGAVSTATLAVTVESVGIDFSRPHGKRFGTLVHAVLSVVDLNADADAVKAVAELQGRLYGASEAEITAAAGTVTRALAHSLMRRAAAASKIGLCRRETPVAILLEDGMLVEGIVDLAFIEDTSGWVVVDFKTDFEIEGKVEEYRAQVGLYARAISRATGLAATAVLLRL
jgi:ATP-dependent exoDNAse (exonuclease V) beta subunit